MTKANVCAKYLGLISYAKGLQLQAAYKSRLLSRGLNSLLFLEHSPVYTVGIRSKEYSDAAILASLRSLGADFHVTDRGGLITFHGPGQLVVYPIVDLRILRDKSVKQFVAGLEQAVINVCRTKYNIPASRSPPYPGVWVDHAKICAIGLHVSRYRTSHGIALNCSSNLSWFDHIVPCGIEGRSVTSISNFAGREVTPLELINPLLNALSAQFDMDIDV